MSKFASIRSSYRFIKMAAAAAQYYIRFRICWYRCLQKVKVYQQTKFRRHIPIDGWDITTSVFEKQTSAILEIYFRFRFRPFARNLHIILHQVTEFRPNQSTHCRNMTLYPLLKMAGGRNGWILLPVSYLLMSLPSECQSLLANQIISRYLKWRLRYFLWKSKMAWEGVKFVFKIKNMCQYPGMLCYIFWIQKCIFDACRQRLHNSGLICNQAIALQDRRIRRMADVKKSWTALGVHTETSADPSSLTTSLLSGHWPSSYHPNKLK